MPLALFRQATLPWLTLALFLGFDSIRLRAEAETEPPTVTAVIPEPGAVHRLEYVEIQFSEPVTGLEADDLKANEIPCLAVRQISADIYSFTLPPLLPGAVRLEWRRSASIADLADVPNLFVGEDIRYTLLPPLRPGGVVISEFVADNQKTLRDDDGDYVDWIELQNLTDEPVELTGCHLTDEPDQPAKWTFPETFLPARGFLVVFASGKDRVDPTRRLHTNFRLNNSGEYLGLTAPDGVPVSNFAPRYPALPPDVAYGRAAGAPDQTGFLQPPTPGAPNAITGQGFAPAVLFSAEGGPTTATNLTLRLDLASPAPGALIRWSTDGRIPTLTNGVDYTGPLHLSLTGAVQVRTRAFQTGFFPGPVRSEVYTPLGSNILGFRSDLPLLVVNTFGRVPAEARNTVVNFELHELKDGVAVVTNAPDFQTRGGMKVRGSSSASLAKKQYAVQWTDEFDQDRELPVLGMPEESEWVLYAPNNYDTACIHNTFIHQLARDIGEYSPRTRYVEVFLNTSGPLTTNQYLGLYVLMEKPGIGSARIPGPKLQPEENLPPDVTGPYVMKIDRLDPGDSGLQAGGQTVAMISPKERELRSAARAPQRTYLVNYLNAMRNGLQPVNRRNPTNGYAAYIDVPQAIDYHLIEVLSGNVDAVVLSAYFNKPRNEKLVFGPHWDFDRALGSTDGRDANPRMWTTGQFFNGWFGQLFGDIEAWQQWVDRYQQLRTNQFANRHTWSLADRLANEIRQGERRDFFRWRIARRFGGFQGEIDAMKRWVSNRLDFIDRQLAQPPLVNLESSRVAPGTLLVLRTNWNGTTNAEIWFTLDGTDPRAVGTTNRSASAQRYLAPVPIHGPVRLVARVLDIGRRQSGGPPVSTPWSGPATRHFVTEVPPLSLTEIHFHPADPGEGEPYQSDDFEFLELKNTSGRVLNLAGFRLSGETEFEFGSNGVGLSLPPGGRVLVVENTNAFAARYPGAGPVAGEYRGRLNNRRAQLRLTDPVGTVVFDFAYEDTWVKASDGGGFSLVPRRDSAQAFELDNPLLWVASAVRHGSPGLPDLASDAAPDGDLDGDGLADLWEWAWFGGLASAEATVDSDGDGYPNREEFLAGTNPRDPASAPHLRVVPSPFGENPVLEFDRVGARTYRLLYQDRLDPTGPWTELLRFVGDGELGPGRFRDLTTTNGTRYYRLATP